MGSLSLRDRSWAGTRTSPPSSEAKWQAMERLPAMPLRDAPLAIERQREAPGRRSVWWRAALAHWTRRLPNHEPRLEPVVRRPDPPESQMFEEGAARCA